MCPSRQNIITRRVFFSTIQIFSRQDEDILEFVSSVLNFVKQSVEKDIQGKALPIYNSLIIQSWKG